MTLIRLYKRGIKVVDDLQEDNMPANILCKMARKSIKATQARMGSLVGTDHSIVSKRESGALAPNPTYTALCKIIVKMVQPGMRKGQVAVTKEQILESLEEIPMEKRSESNAVFRLQKLCWDSGRSDVAEDIMGISKPDGLAEGERDEESMFALVEHISDIKNRIKDYSKDLDPSSKAKFEQSVLLTAQLVELLRMGVEEANNKKKKGKGSGK